MNTISFRAIRQFVTLHPDSESALTAWYKIARKARWRNLAEVRRVYPHADTVGRYTVFNIRGNNYRLVAEINYQYQQILIRKILTHEEYDEGKWKS
ncbi:MAG: type II toxin-antitoxin system HigB family toxin [Pyrinomonadaceae bacterium]